MRLVAKRFIPAGSELLIEYGGGYWGQLKKNRKISADEDDSGTESDEKAPRAARLRQRQQAAAPKVPLRPALKQAQPAPLAPLKVGGGRKQAQPVPAAQPQPPPRQRFKFGTGLCDSFGVGASKQRAPAQSAASDSDIIEPRTYQEALDSPQREQWMAAIAAEKEVFAASKTFTPIFSQLPDHIKLLGTKWVFKLKRDEEGRVARFKARLVAQGFGQRADDFDETFSPTLGQLPLRALMPQQHSRGSS